MLKISSVLSLDVHRPLERDLVVRAHAGVSGECYPQGFEIHEVKWVTKLGESFLKPLPKPWLSSLGALPGSLLPVGKWEVLRDVTNRLNPQCHQLVQFRCRNTWQVLDVVHR